MYSQRGEDDYLITLFGDDPGRFLDIGAFDGKTNSNTWWAVEKGWSGLMIEPAAVPFAGLLRNVAELSEQAQKRLRLINCAVAPERGLFQFHHSPDQVSTMDSAHYETWKNDGQYQDCYVYAVTIGDILNQFGGRWDLISVDAEGLSCDICMQMPLREMLPKAVVVEHNGNRLVEIGQWFRDLRCGYVQGWIGGENAIFHR